MNDNKLTSYNFLATLTENGKDLFGSVYIPICKRALSMYSKKGKEFGADSDIQDEIFEMYGLNVPTCIMVFKKCRENPEDVLFIDSSKHFERGTQNILRPADLEKIITTYRERKEVDKYSYLAPLSEIHENEYNLNIPRYVNTFEEEEPVDIVTVSEKLKTLETKMSDTDKELIALCKELNIDTPF